MLKLLFLVLKLVLDALDVQLQLLLDFYVIPHLSLVLLKHRLVFAWSFLTTYCALAFYVVTLCVSFTSTGFSLLFLFALFHFLLFFHFHVHKDFNAGFDVLEDCEGIRIMKPFPLLSQHILIVGIDLQSKRH